MPESRTPFKDFVERRITRAFETGRILPLIITSVVVLVIASGVLMWIVDRKDFPTIGVALWWAAQTVTTVGYGDVTPVQPAGRVVATGLMIVGFASLSLLTGVIASLLVNRRTSAQARSTVDRVEERLVEIERLLRSREAS